MIERITANAAPRSGLTMVEMLVAVTISLIIIAAGTTTYIQMSREIAETRAYYDATANARVALRDMSFEIKQANASPVDPLIFLGVDVQGTTGDRIDNDGDAAVDEDRPDGIDGDAAFTDRHALILTRFERQAFVGFPDLGDAGIDEDPVFDADTLEFRIFPVATPRNDWIRYSIGTFEDEDNVLLREIVTDPGGPATTTSLEPIAYNVMSLNFLFWDANLATPYWVPQWDATAGPFPGPDLDLPVAVYIEVSVYAGLIPLDILEPTEPIEVLTLSTIVNIESMLTDPRYDAIRPPS